MQNMKTIQRTLLVSIIPLLTPLSAVAETGNQAELTNQNTSEKGSAGSWRASQFMGLDVKNADGKEVGEVKDLVINVKTGEILAVIISSGTYLGKDDTFSAVPVTSLDHNGSDKGFTTTLTKEQLGNAPNFKTNAWPNYNEGRTIEAMRDFRDSVSGDANQSRNTSRNDHNAAHNRNAANRDNTARDRDNATRGADNTARNRDNTNRDADNTAQNKEERNKDTRNPTDQGNSEKDRQMTQDIRSAIMDTDMSFNAKNIKIMTQNEKVHLKGVVESKEEHQAILRIAKNHVNGDALTDDLKVKTN